MVYRELAADGRVLRTNALSVEPAGGTWAGSGLTSAAVKNDAEQRTTRDSPEASDSNSISGDTAAFANEIIDGTAVLVRYTRYDDTDLVASINDFNLLAGHFGAAPVRCSFRVWRADAHFVRGETGI